MKLTNAHRVAVVAALAGAAAIGIDSPAFAAWANMPGYGAYHTNAAATVSTWEQEDNTNGGYTRSRGATDVKPLNGMILNHTDQEATIYSASTHAYVTEMTSLTTNGNGYVSYPNNTIKYSPASHYTDWYGFCMAYYGETMFTDTVEGSYWTVTYQHEECQ